MSKGASQITYTYLKNGLEEKAIIPLHKTGGDEVLMDLISNNQLLSIHSGEPTLNDIFVELTGRQLQ
jgi:fluoroquinolone transport system ATP-binding protein